ncbi:unnamed protein product, partial [Rotaria sp. Silwood2]
MFFCEKTDPNLPATCPTLNENGPRINCSQGEYGYELFEIGQIGYRSYKLDLNSELLSGQHCIRFYYYLSDNKSNGTINVIIEDNQSNQNQTILTIYSPIQNKWHSIRTNFYIDNQNPTIYFLFQKQSSLDSLPFYMAIDDITIIDLECEPIITTTTTITTTEHIISTITSIILSSITNILSTKTSTTLTILTTNKTISSSTTSTTLTILTTNKTISSST